MDAKVEPPKKKKKANPPTPPPRFHPPLSPSFSSLPDELIVNCLARISQSHYRSLCLVSKSFHSFVSSPYIYAVRSQIGATEPRIHICLRSPTYHRWYTLDQNLTSNGCEIKNELTLVPRNRPPSNYPAPMQSTTVAVGYEIYQIGGTNNRSSVVRVLDCRNNMWRDAPNMRVARKRAMSCYFDGKIYVMGGYGKKETWGEVFDLKTQTWKQLPRPEDVVLHSSDKFVVFGGKLYIITKDNKYGYDPKEGRWLLEAGFSRLERVILGPWCVIENVMFNERRGRYMWYHSRSGGWSNVLGLGDLYMKLGDYYVPATQFFNYGEKLVIILEDMKRNKKIWCAVIRLEKRIGFSGRLEIWGNVEQLKFASSDPNSYQVLSCLSVSL